MKKYPKDENATVLAGVVKAYMIKNGLTEIIMTREDMETSIEQKTNLTLEVTDEAKLFKLTLHPGVPTGNPFDLSGKKADDTDIN